MSGKYLRFAARGLSIPIIAIWGFFLIASLFGDAGRGSRPLTLCDYITVTAIVASLAGLCATWKWELLGAGMTLVVVAIGTAFNARILMSPTVVIPLTACLFVAASISTLLLASLSTSRSRLP